MTEAVPQFVDITLSDTELDELRTGRSCVMRDEKATGITVAVYYD